MALPTYAVTLRDGPALFSDVKGVAAVRAHAQRVSYFRMPTSGDAAALGWATLIAIDSAPTVVDVDDNDVFAFVVAAADGAFDVVIENAGAYDAPHGAVAVAGVGAYDVVGDVVARRAGAGVVFVAKNARYLRPHERQTVAWVRPATGDTHALAPLSAVVVDDPRAPTATPSVASPRR